MLNNSDSPEKASLCVKKFPSVKNATKSCRTKKGSPKITCVEERCCNCEEFVNPNKQPMLYEADSQSRRRLECSTCSKKKQEEKSAKKPKTDFWRR